MGIPCALRHAGATAAAAGILAAAVACRTGTIPYAAGKSRAAFAEARLIIRGATARQIRVDTLAGAGRIGAGLLTASLLGPRLTDAKVQLAPGSAQVLKLGCRPRACRPREREKSDEDTRNGMTP